MRESIKTFIVVAMLSRGLLSLSVAPILNLNAQRPLMTVLSATVRV